MKKVTIMYMKGLDFKHLLISIDGKKFNEDKTDFISSEPIPDWFSPTEDDFFEWEGLVTEIEKYTNMQVADLQFEFIGHEEDEKIFWEKSKDYGIYKKEKNKFEISEEKKSKNVNARYQKELEQACINLEKKNFNAAFTGFKNAAEKLPMAKFKMGEMFFFGKGREKSYVQAFELFQECERETKEFPELNSALAQCHYYGFGTEKNEKKAYKYALRGFGGQKPYGDIAHYIAGCYLLSGNEINKNLDEAINHLKICVDARKCGFKELGMAYERKGECEEAFNTYNIGVKSDKNCYYYLAKCYEEGKGTKQDSYKAYENMKKVPDSDYQGKLALAQYYLIGYGTEQNMDEVAKICRFLTENNSGQPELLYKIAVIYIHIKEYVEAIKLLEEAIKLGLKNGKKELGYCYIKIKMYEKAEENLKQAADNSPEDGEIYDYLGKCFFNDKIKDNSKAIEYFEKGVSLGNADAAFSLYKYYSSINDKKNKTKYFEIAKKNGHSMAKMIEGVNQFEKGNIERAIKLLKEAAQKGNIKAQYYLGKCYLSENYIQKDVYEGIRWLTKAAEREYGRACFELACFYGKEQYEDKEKSYEFALKGAEIGNINCQYKLAKYYLYLEEYRDEENGLKILRKLSKEFLSAKCLLLDYYFEKYSCWIYDIRKNNEGKKLTEKDIRHIKEMMNLCFELKNNPDGLTKNQRNRIKCISRKIASSSLIFLVNK